MRNTLNAAVVAAVRSALKERGIAQKDAAAALCMSQQAFSDRMRGRTPFTLHDLEQLPLLGIEVAEVLYPTTTAVPA